MQDGLHRLELDGIEISYRAVGDEHAPTVVFLHGWASSRRMWEDAQRHLGGQYRTLALDLPGHGASGKPPWTWYSIPNFARAVTRFLESLRTARPAIIGHSMGGTIALEMAASRQLELSALIAVNPVVTGRVYSRTIPLHDGWFDSAVRMSRRVWPTASRWLTRPPEAVRRRAPEHLLRNSEDFAHATPDSMLGSMRAVLRWDLRDRLPLIQAPSLIVVGRVDRIVSPEEGEIAAAGILGARLLRLPAGHHPNDEIPQEFYPPIESFLAGRGIP